MDLSRERTQQGNQIGLFCVLPSPFLPKQKKIPTPLTALKRKGPGYLKIESEKESPLFIILLWTFPIDDCP
jgi:hypothetical protein